MNALETLPNRRSEKSWTSGAEGNSAPHPSQGAMQLRSKAWLDWWWQLGRNPYRYLIPWRCYEDIDPVSGRRLGDLGTLIISIGMKAGVQGYIPLSQCSNSLLHGNINRSNKIRVTKTLFGENIDCQRKSQFTNQIMLEKRKKDRAREGTTSLHPIFSYYFRSKKKKRGAAPLQRDIPIPFVSACKRCADSGKLER